MMAIELPAPGLAWQWRAEDVELVAELAERDRRAYEIAELAPDLPSDVVEAVRRGLTQEEREQLRASMSYPEGSVGALMDFETISVRADYSLEAVLRYLRTLDELPDHTDALFVVDRGDKLLGILPIKKLLLGQPVEKVLNQDAMANPGCLPWYVAFAQAHLARSA